MKTLTNLQQYIPEEDARLLGENVLYLRSDEGEDWYSSQKLFSDETVKIAYDKSGVIRSMSKDISLLWPVGFSVTEVDEAALPDGFNIDGGWTYSKGEVVKRKLSDEELFSQNEEKKSELIRNATTKINPLQDAVDLKVATEEESSSLEKWKMYRVTVNRIDSSEKEINWPDIPA